MSIHSTFATMKYLVLILFLVFFSCKNKSEKQDRERVLATVDEQNLYASDIEISEGLKGKDSIELAKKMIDDWVKNQLLYRFAKDNVNETDEIELAVENFRRDYTLLMLQKELLKINLDTNFNKQDIDSFYYNNKDLFLLKNDLVNLQVIILNKNVKADSALFYFNHIADKDTREILEEYCTKSTLLCMIDENNWYNGDEVKEKYKFLSGKLSETNGEVRKTTNSEGLIVLYKINHYLKAGSTKPLALAQADIKQILLNKRSQNVVKDKMNAIYQDELQKNTHKIY